jgi:hypothetical protein
MDRERLREVWRMNSKLYRERHPDRIQTDKRRASVRAGVARYRARKKAEAEAQAEKGQSMT